MVNVTDKSSGDMGSQRQTSSKSILFASRPISVLVLAPCASSITVTCVSFYASLLLRRNVQSIVQAHEGATLQEVTMSHIDPYGYRVELVSQIGDLCL